MNNIYDIWFARVEVANSIKLRLYKDFSTKEIFSFNQEEFLDLGIKDISIEKFMDKTHRKNLEKYEKYMKENNIYQIFCDDERYPEKLKNISNLPTYIFLKRKLKFNV